MFAVKSVNVARFPEFTFKLLTLAIDFADVQHEANYNCPHPNAGEDQAQYDQLDHPIGIKKKLQWRKTRALGCGVGG